MSLYRDLRFGIRSLRKSPGLLTVAALSIGLGIGLNTTIFSVVHTALFRPADVERPDELVSVYASRAGLDDLQRSSYPDLLDLRAQSASFSGLVGESTALVTVEREGTPYLEIGTVVTEGYFELLGVHPRMGRVFEPGEYRARAGAPVVVLSHGYWRHKLGGDPGILGREVRIGGARFEVIGVLPEGFGGMTRALAAELFVPISMIDHVEPAGEISTEGRSHGSHPLDWRGYRFLNLYGRLAEGVSLPQAAAEVKALTAGFAAEYPETNLDYSARLMPTSEVHFDPDLDRVLLPVAGVLLGMVGIVLLVACANLANLLLARATGRRREIAVRLAIGAGRARLVRQLLVESLLLALFGGLAGLGFAALGVRAFGLLRADLPIQPTLDLRLDPPVLLFTLTLALATGLLFRLVPALQSSKTDLVSSLKCDGTVTEKVRGPIGRVLQPGGLLVVAQVALSMVLVAGASLLLHSLSAARALDLGFEAERIGVLVADLSSLGIEDGEAGVRWRRLEERVGALPGVEATAVATRMPLGINIHQSDFFIPGHRESPSEPPLNLDVTQAGAGYFGTLGVERIEGRLFDDRDRPDTPRVAVITRAMQRRFWPGESAVGKRFRVGTADAPEVEVVGVVEDYKVRTPGEAPRPMVHFAFSQRPQTYGHLIFRAAGPAAAALEAAVREVRAAEPDLFLMDTATMGEMRDLILLPLSAGGVLVGGLSLLALLLAGVGLSGLIAYRVGRRRREIGIRMALGADRRSVLAGVLARSFTLIGIGAALGLGGSVALGRLLRQALYVPALDPLSLAVAVAALGATGLAASVLPARRATGIDPLVALRES